jgi:hypothetical protein
VSKHEWYGLFENGQGLGLAIPKVRDQQFELCVRPLPSNGLGAISEVTCPAVGQVVAIDACNDQVFDLHPSD